MSIFEPSTTWFDENETILDFEQIKTPEHCKTHWPKNPELSFCKRHLFRFILCIVFSVLVFVWFYML
jgi:hypothetical protein